MSGEGGIIAMQGMIWEAHFVLRTWFSESQANYREFSREFSDFQAKFSISCVKSGFFRNLEPKPSAKLL